MAYVSFISYSSDINGEMTKWGYIKVIRYYCMFLFLKCAKGLFGLLHRELIFCKCDDIDEVQCLRKFYMNMRMLAHDHKINFQKSIFFSYNTMLKQVVNNSTKVILSGTTSMNCLC